MSIFSISCYDSYLSFVLERGSFDVNILSNSDISIIANTSQEELSYASFLFLEAFVALL